MDHFIGQELGTETLRRSTLQQTGRITAVEHGIRIRIGINHHLFRRQPSANGRQVAEPVPVHDQAVERIAHTNTPGLGIEHDIGTFSPVTCGIEIGMANTGTRFNHRNTGVIPHIVDQTFAAARDQQINIADGTEQCSGGRTVCRQQSYRMLIHSVCLQHFPDHLHDRFIRIAGRRGRLSAHRHFRISDTGTRHQN